MDKRSSDDKIPSDDRIIINGNSPILTEDKIRELIEFTTMSESERRKYINDKNTLEYLKRQAEASEQQAHEIHIRNQFTKNDRTKNTITLICTIVSAIASIVSIFIAVLH